MSALPILTRLVKSRVIVPGYVRADGTRVDGYTYSREDGGTAPEGAADWERVLSDLDQQFGRFDTQAGASIVRSGESFRVNLRGAPGTPGQSIPATREGAAAVLADVAKPEEGGLSPWAAYQGRKYQDASWGLNRALRAGKKPRGRAKAIHEALTEAYEAREPEPEPVSLFRAIPEDLAAELKIGDEYGDPAWQSTAPDANSTTGYGESHESAQAPKAVLRFDVPEGGKILPLSQAETLLGPGSAWRVASVGTVEVRGKNQRLVVMVPRAPAPDAALDRSRFRKPDGTLKFIKTEPGVYETEGHYVYKDSYEPVREDETARGSVRWQGIDLGGERPVWHVATKDKPEDSKRMFDTLAEAKRWVQRT